MTETQLLPVLPLRDIVVFPHMVVPLFVGREKSINALEEVMRQEKRILLLTQKEKTLAAQTRSQFEGYGKLNKKIAEEVVASVGETKDAAKLADVISVHLNADIENKQALLAERDVAERLNIIMALMDAEVSVLKVEKKVRGRVKRQMEKTQREYYLNEQMKAIQTELGNGDAPDEMAEIEKKVEETKLTKQALEKLTAEIKKLKQMSPMSAEANVSRNYIDWMLSVPWGKKKRVQRDLAKAQEILDTDHYGLDKVKERIIEHLAVQTRTKKVKGPILCLVGPPGVGKTSLGKSVARATGREFVRVSLGGVRDESEIRGHRRTYIGSMPGRIIQSMKKAKYNNPMFLFDEVDKMGMDHRGDPSSALLEVLDPEQNDTFNDHYLDVDYDLSDVMFITTANSLNMPQPLLDRMEIIRIPGYTEDEKIEIATRHLLPGQIEDHGLKAEEFSVSEDADILTIEALSMPGKGSVKITGNLKDVMKESISAANSYVQARAPELGISPRVFRTTDIHVHVPEGATPKDGPSAGIGMVTAMVSVLTEIPVRNDIAMTGEVTLRGRVLPIGGLKEKLLAALRGGVKTVLIPQDNEKDLADIPDNVKSELEIIPVRTVALFASLSLVGNVALFFQRHSVLVSFRDFAF